ncbi:N-6 DNA methylase [Agrobacterium sp. ST15.13.015]|uniref:N-6 DNA methylase n=1 Tax=Agrobacterium sp. ST15.13.015 TaxID=3017319 RepID=UPI0022C39D7E|nr:N-6 DNA methylase [Agrobacterium sp. ST15.13.015]MCZ7498674.1 N-6 DNA methylase [Rhizobium rhizogenes]
MLDTDTKRRIDTCRDILVGKVPDPKSQVEQITIALIYKFMDDMDLEAEELGGERRFFTKDYERYRWAKLVAPGVSGQDMLNTYSEALTNMVQNEELPKLFRDIFRNAYLPYRDPETLRAFLREINSFTYDHSEKLGDAFEYLLSVLGSQGDAGQFRTPRHIIDFMVEIINPQKNEVIMDPACGTAGFLISAYKHILKQNSTGVVNGNGASTEGDAAEQALESPMRYPGDLLQPDDRARLACNIRGYDISPDMVRLSLVNLYLHGFADPKVEEYDTLTSEDKWTETADVILANPPFMSPKGGIKPHTRFQVQSKRSEVLFVDYIAEHLAPNGRAAIVVPEGIIFQSQSAYVALRKMLVENHLAAVISLPAGVFNPYSGVKTSILILDRSVAKSSQHVAFFKIENDGFALGAQRKAVRGSQLAQVKAELGAWLQVARAGGGEELESSLGFAVPRSEFVAGSDYNLSSERYRQEVAAASEWPRIKIGDVCKTGAGGTPATDRPEFYKDGVVPWLKSGEISQGEIFYSETYITEEALNNSSAKIFPPDAVLVAMYGATAGEVGILRIAASTNQAVCALVPDERLDPGFLYRLLRHNKATLIRFAGGGAQPNISQKIVRDIEIPLPPLEVQREIVAEVESYQRVIDGARAILDNYRPRISVDPEWPMVELEEIFEALEAGVSVNSENRTKLPGELGVLKTSAVTSGIFNPNEHKAVLPEEVDRVKCSPRKGSIIISRMNTEALVGASAYVDDDFPDLFLPDRLWQTVIIRPDVSAKYIHTVIASDEYRARISSICGGTSGSMKNVAKSQLMKIVVPLPNIDIQQAIVADIEAEQALVDGNRDLIARFEKKIDAAIARVWGEAKAEEVA